ncbi:MAG: diadenylate cyclase CdaA [Clostridiales bacterium]
MEWNFLTIFISLVDILIVAYAGYKILLLLKDSRAMQLLKGMVVILGFYILSGWLNLTTVHWILGKSWSVILLGIAIIFQPELRSALEKLGRGGSFFASGNSTSAITLTEESIEETLVAASEQSVGVLLVLEGSTGLKPQIDTGVALDAKISSELLRNIFFKNAPLHDGAVIVRNDRVVAAGCIMPLTANDDIDPMLGTRHRAGIGISEVSDALVLIVSEETGVVSMCRYGKLIRGVTPQKLHRAFDDFYGINKQKTRKKRKRP